MAIQSYTTQAGRINKFKGEIIGHAVYNEVLGITGQLKKMPKNNGDTVVYASYLPYGATTSDANTQNRPVVTVASHLTNEGVTPNADSLVRRDITVQLQQYACLYGFTDKTYDMYEDDIPAEMKKQTGERVGLLREMIRYGVLKSGTNGYYSGGSSRATVASAVTFNFLSKISRNLLANHGTMITRILAPSQNFATAPVEAGFIVFSHTDCEHDIRLIPGFKHVAEYGSRKPMHDMELGSVGRFRFIVSADLAPYTDAGATASGTGLVTSGTKVDVYPMIVVAEEAWGDVALRGSESVDPTWLPPGQKDKSDPHGQRGYVGAKFYTASFIANQGWMAVGEVGISSL